MENMENWNQLLLLKEIIRTEQSKSDYDNMNYLSDFTDDDGLLEAIENNTIKDYLLSLNDDNEITNYDCIYYSEANKILTETNSTINEALEIADEFWFNTKNLDSCLLASLLVTRQNEEMLDDLINDIVEQFEK